MFVEQSDKAAIEAAADARRQRPSSTTEKVTRSKREDIAETVVLLASPVVAGIIGHVHGVPEFDPLMGWTGRALERSPREGKLEAQFHEGKRQ